MNIELTLRQKEILEFIRWNDGCSTADIVDHTKLHNTTVLISLTRLESTNHIWVEPLDKGTSRKRKYYAIDSRILVG